MASFEELLEMTKKDLMQEAEDQGYEFSNQTRKAIIVKEMADDVVDRDDHTSLSEKSDAWQKEFRKASERALRSSLEEGRSYNVFEKKAGQNMFNLAPAYMKWDDEEKVPLLTIVMYANA